MTYKRQDKQNFVYSYYFVRFLPATNSLGGAFEVLSIVKSIFALFSNFLQKKKKSSYTEPFFFSRPEPQSPSPPSPLTSREKGSYGP